MSGRPIWKLASHLVGLASDVARRRLLMALTVYVDESGTDGPPVFVMAGFIARAEQWEAFNNEWKSVLEEPPALEAFHMAEVNWAGGSEKLPKLFDIIKRHVLCAFVLTVNHEDYNAAFKDKFSKIIDRIYYFMYLHMLEMATTWQQVNGLNEKMEFFFDKKDEESKHIRSNYEEFMRNAHPDVRERIAMCPLWVDDKEFRPLQAADILAWIFRKFAVLHYSGQPLDTHFREFLDSIPIARRNFTKKALQQLANNGLKRTIQQGRLTEHENERSLPFRDFILQNINLERIVKARPGEVIPLFSLPATQMKRFHLIHSCAKCDIPHLHRRVGGE